LRSVRIDRNIDIPGASQLEPRASCAAHNSLEAAVEDADALEPLRRRRCPPGDTEPLPRTDGVVPWITERSP
jgi:hypothetical protein